MAVTTAKRKNTKLVHPADNATDNTKKSIINNEINYVRKKIKKNALNREVLIVTLRRTNGNVSQAAEILNVSRMTIYRIIKKMETEGVLLLGQD